jgi:hypothetical protein
VETSLDEGKAGLVAPRTANANGEAQFEAEMGHIREARTRLSKSRRILLVAAPMPPLHWLDLELQIGL